MGKRSKTTTGFINICGTFEFLSGIKNVLASVDMNCSLLQGAKKDTNTWSLQFGGNKVVRRFYEFLYRDSIIHLERKYNIFINLFAILKKRDDYNNENTKTLTKQNIADIRMMLAQKLTYKVIGQKFGVSIDTIYHIRYNLRAYKNK
jgi:uncharacterized protein YerC